MQQERKLYEFCLELPVNILLPEQDAHQLFT
jgi:hypothetical protein